MKIKQDLNPGSHRVLIGRASSEERCYSCQYFEIIGNGSSFKRSTSLEESELLEFLKELDNLSNFINEAKEGFIKDAIKDTERKIRLEGSELREFDFELHAKNYGEEKSNDYRSSRFKKLEDLKLYLARLHKFGNPISRESLV